jgi:predicted ArsR family transcriptional regulator
VVLAPIKVPDKGEPPMAKDQEKHARPTRAAKVTSLLMRHNGATLAEMAKIVDWQPHSVRGFMSGALKKKQGLDVASKRSGLTSAFGEKH